MTAPKPSAGAREVPDKLIRDGHDILTPTEEYPNGNWCAEADTIDFAEELVIRYNSQPELLEACKAVIQDLEWGTTARWKGEGSAMIRAAIAKAEANP